MSLTLSLTQTQQTALVCLDNLQRHAVQTRLFLFFFFCSFRYEDAVSKYEAVMKTEPNVPHFTLLAKERMCHALAQVRPLQIGETRLTKI